jgi:hypothetical protein
VTNLQQRSGRLQNRCSTRTGRRAGAGRFISRREARAHLRAHAGHEGSRRRFEELKAPPSAVTGSPVVQTVAAYSPSA